MHPGKEAILLPGLQGYLWRQLSMRCTSSVGKAAMEIGKKM